MPRDCFIESIKVFGSSFSTTALVSFFCPSVGEGAGRGGGGYMLTPSCVTIEFLTTTSSKLTFQYLFIWFWGEERVREEEKRTMKELMEEIPFFSFHRLNELADVVGIERRALGGQARGEIIVTDNSNTIMVNNFSRNSQFTISTY